MTCAHENTAAVDVTLPDPTGDTVTETVARICTDCYEQLPAAWGCTDCAWVDVRRLCDVVPTLILGQPCPLHAT